MAAKQSPINSGTAQDPRIASKELIVTRHKSAQLKRQLRSGDRSMKKITQLLKSPERSKQPTVDKSNGPQLKTYRNKMLTNKTSPKSQNPLAAHRRSCNKSPRKRIASESAGRKEFYPSKVKRKTNNKTVKLKPKYELTKVVSLNKRKRTTPRKGNVVIISLFRPLLYTGLFHLAPIASSFGHPHPHVTSNVFQIIGPAGIHHCICLPSSTNRQ